jgi:hypothetical protein
VLIPTNADAASTATVTGPAATGTPSVVTGGASLESVALSTTCLLVVGATMFVL